MMVLVRPIRIYLKFIMYVLLTLSRFEIIKWHEYNTATCSTSPNVLILTTIQHHRLLRNDTNTPVCIILLQVSPKTFSGLTPSTDIWASEDKSTAPWWCPYLPWVMVYKEEECYYSIWKWVHKFLQLGSWRCIWCYFYWWYGIKQLPGERWSKNSASSHTNTHTTAFAPLSPYLYKINEIFLYTLCKCSI